MGRTPIAAGRSTPPPASAYLHRGIAIEFNRVVPEAMKPRKIAIGSSSRERQRIAAPEDKALELPR